MIRLVIADDHHLVRQGIRALLEKSGEVQVVAEAATGQEAVDMVQQHEPDGLIMDLSMPRLDGVQATDHILRDNPQTRIIILSMYSDTAMIQQLLRRGVKGYLVKDAIADELMVAVHAAVQGRTYLSPTISDAVMSMLLSPADTAVAESRADLLTPREKEVLQLVSEGMTNRAIANTLSISVKTVEKHRASVMSKLDVNDFASLMRKALALGLVFSKPDM